MGCGEFVVKYTLFLVNFFFALAGLALLGIGVAVQLQVTVVQDIFEVNFDVAPILTIIVGGIVFIVAFLGCCGSVKESSCMLITYSLFMIVLMIIKIALASVIFVNINALIDAIPRWLNEAFVQSNTTPFHEIESTFKCCGTTGPLSYGNVLLPGTCCTDPTCTVLNSYNGCNEVIAEFFHTFGLVIGIICIIVVAIELVAVVFALCLGTYVRNKNRRSRY